MVHELPLPAGPVDAVVTRNDPEPSARQKLVAGAAYCASVAGLALGAPQLGLGGELALLLPVAAMLGVTPMVSLPAWAPAAAAGAGLAAQWLGSGVLSMITVLGFGIGAVLASVTAAKAAERGRRTHDEIGALQESNQELAAANAAKREASEVAEAVLAATRDISASLDAGEVAVRVARNACCATQGAAGAVLLWDADREVFRIAAVAGAGGGTEVQQLEVTGRAVPPLQRALVEGVVDVPRSALHDPVFDALMRRWKASAVLAARLQRGDRALGVVLAARRLATPASPKAQRILNGIALQAAAALESANLVNDLRTASNLKEEFMATMSHELRTPLNVIIGYTDLQREGAFGDLPPDHMDILDRVHGQALQLLELIQATLDVGRLERGLMTVDVRDVSLQELMAQLFAAIPPVWRKASVDLRWRVDPAVPKIRSDPGKLQVLLRNLVHNALKFTEAGQVQVTVTADTNGERVHFVVQDTGCGIAAHDLNVIFDMFRQSSDRDPSVAGVGLGLYIVKRLVELLGGEIDVRSAPGRGATFRIHLPTAGPHAATSRVGMAVVSARMAPSGL